MPRTEHGHNPLKPKWALIAGSLLLGLCTLVGIHFSLSSHVVSFSSPTSLALTLFIFALASTALYLAFCWIYSLLIKDDQTGKASNPRKWMTFVYSAIILMCWVPYLLAFFPGSIPYDGMYQLNQYFGYMPFTDQHPALSTALIGGIVSFGSVFGSIDAGVFLFCILQSIISSLIYGYSCFTAEMLTKRKLFAIISMLFFCLVPVWGAWAQTVGKDTLYYSMFALLVTQTCRLVFSRRGIIGFDAWQCTLLVIAAIGISLLRKDGIIIAAVTLAFILAASKKYALISLSALLAFGITQAPLSALLVDDDAPSQPYEAFSLPFQQTARLAQEHGDELSMDDISRIHVVLNYETLAERYDPTDADPVKDQAYTTASPDQVVEYFETYARLGLKYPKTYLDAFLEQTYGYYYPPYKNSDLTDCKFYILTDHEYMPNYLEIEYANGNPFAGLRNVLVACEDFFASTPLHLLQSSGMATWITIGVICVLLQGRKFRYIVICVPLILCLGVCLLSPINAYLRYSLAMIASCPILIASAKAAFISEHETLTQQTSIN